MKICKVNTKSSLALAKELSLPFWVYGNGGKSGEITIIEKGAKFNISDEYIIKGVDGKVYFKGGGLTWQLHLVCDESYKLYYYVINDSFSEDNLKINHVYLEDGSDEMPFIKDAGYMIIPGHLFDEVKCVELITKKEYDEFLNSNITNTCVKCGYHNPYMDPILDYTCRKCSIMQGWVSA